MGQKVSPSWQKVGARCVATISGKNYDAVILQTCTATTAGTVTWYIKIAVRNPFDGRLLVNERKEPVSFKHLIRRERYVHELDSKEDFQTA